MSSHSTGLNLNLATAHLLLSPPSAERSPTSQPNVRETGVLLTVGQYLFAARLLGHGTRKCDIERIAELFVEALKWKIIVCCCALVKTNSVPMIATDSKQKAYHSYTHRVKQEVKEAFSRTMSTKVASSKLQ